MRHIDSYRLLAILFYAAVVAVGIFFLSLLVSAVGLRIFIVLVIWDVIVAGTFALAEVLADYLRRR